MVDRGLLYREWVQNRTVLVMVGLFLAAVNPFEVLNTYLVYQGCLDTPEAYCNFYVNSLDSGMLNLNWAPAVILAVCLFGLERTKGTLDTLFSLPYSRAQVFHTKFWLGAAVIAGFQIIGYGLAELLILVDGWHVDIDLRQRVEVDGGRAVILAERSNRLQSETVGDVEVAVCRHAL